MINDLVFTNTTEDMFINNNDTKYYYLKEGDAPLTDTGDCLYYDELWYYPMNFIENVSIGDQKLYKEITNKSKIPIRIPYKTQNTITFDEILTDNESSPFAENRTDKFTILRRYLNSGEIQVFQGCYLIDSYKFSQENGMKNSISMVVDRIIKEYPKDPYKILLTAALPEGYVAYYRFRGGSLLDETNKYNLTKSYITNDFIVENKYVDFSNGIATDKQRLYNSTYTKVPTKLSVSYWVRKPSVYLTDGNDISIKGTGSKSEGLNFGFFKASYSLYKFKIQTRTTTQINLKTYLNLTPEEVPNEWVHMVVTTDIILPGTIKVYVDGVLKVTYTGSIRFSAVMSNIVLGSTTPYLNLFSRNLLSEVLIYERVLEDSEINDIFLKGRG